MPSMRFHEEWSPGDPKGPIQREVLLAEQQLQYRIAQELLYKLSNDHPVE